MPLGGCLRREHIDAFLTGELGKKAMRQVRRHLAGCPKCYAIAEELKEEYESVSSELVGLLRQPGPARQYLDEPEFRRALAKVDALRHKVAVSSSVRVAEQHATALPHPEQLGQYQLLESLGQGGMGIVYKALHTKLRRVVVVKVLSSERMDDAGAAARFHREMEAVGRLDHPHIVRATDAGEANGTCFLVMEFIDGIDLSDLVAALGPLPIGDACELIRQAAMGLDHAHKHGMVHRDIKPSNLILSSDGMVKVLDLGLARLREAPAPHRELTASGQIMGTLDYMAPEQAEDAHSVDIRADIYSLGCTLYKLLAGHAPFSSSKYDTPISKAMAHVRKPPPPISEHRSDVPAGLMKVIHRLLAKDPAKRYATPAAVAEALLPFTGSRDLVTLCNKATGDDPNKFEPPVVASGDTASDSPASVSTHAEPAQTGGKAPKPPPVPPPRQPEPTGVSTGARRERGRFSTRRRFMVAIVVLLLTGGGVFLPQIITWIMSKDGWLTWMQAEQTRPPPAIAPFSAAEAREHQERWASFLGVPVEETNLIGMRFVLIPPGQFMMGSPESEEDRYHDEHQHLVRITKPFYLGVYEVTQDEYQTVMGTNLSNFSSGSSRLPVERVSWEEAVEFCRRLSSLPEEEATSVYRLPTEAEWEYACRAGTTTPYHFGNSLDHEDANVDQDLGLGRTTIVGCYQSNAFGLYDMHGNVWEWCQDWYGGDYYKDPPINNPQGPSEDSHRVRRGGSWDCRPALCRSAVRFARFPSDGEPNLGFRIARTIDLPEPAFSEDAESQNWVSLFNGRDLTGWTPMLSSGKPQDRQPPDGGDWIVRDGELVCDAAESAWLRSEQEFDDFVLQLEFKLPAHANSGVLVRSRKEGHPWLEIQLLGTDYADAPQVDKTAQTGAIFGHVAPTKNVQRGADQWNTMQVRCEGDDVQVRMNGTEIVKGDLREVDGLPDLPRSGFIGFLNHTDTTKGAAKGTAFRNIRIRELRSQPRNPSKQGFVELFDGRTLDGWNFDPEFWRVEDGAIVGEAPTGVHTFLSTEKTYQDFILELKIKRISGNTGIQFRSRQLPNHRLSGCQADVVAGVFDLGILDGDTCTVLEQADSQASQHYNRTDWNEHMVTCKGTRVTINLNGYEILDYAGQSWQLGREGVIGVQLFAGQEAASILLKDIRIRELAPAK